MKTMKRIMALAIALIMTFALTISANAATITVDGEPGTVYTLYKVLNIETDGATAALYTWVSDDFKTAADVTAVTSPAGYVTVTNAASFAKAILDSNPAPTCTVNADVPTNLEDGYYVMKSSAGTTPFAFTVADNAVVTPGTGAKVDTITEKASLPTITKKVEGADKTVVSIGDTIKYTVTVKAEKAGKNYTVVDQLPAGFTYGGTLTVAAPTPLTEGTHYALTVTGHTITVTFMQTYLDSVAASTDIVITYQGTVNSNIAVWDGVSGTLEDLNANTATLYYGDDGDDADLLGELKKVATANVYTGQLSFGKFITGETTRLAGAKFVLKNADGKYAKLGGSYPDFTFNGWVDAVGDDTTITTTAQNANITIKGLVDGTYTLVERDAPDGYTGAGETPVAVAYDAPTVYTIENTPGAILPDTGGIGTPVFYGIGGLLVVAALALLTIRKRSAAK